jgi:hypothetical protein
MDLSYRPMQASDVAACVDHIKSDPILGPQFTPGWSATPPLSD